MTHAASLLALVVFDLQTLSESESNVAESFEAVAFAIHNNLCCNGRDVCACTAYMHRYMHTFMHTYIHACMHAYIHTYTHGCIRTHMHAYIHIYVRTYDTTDKDT